MKAEARSIGPIAHRILRRGGNATVVASFDRSFYLETGGGMTCVVDRSLYDGPLNLVLGTGDLGDLGAEVGDHWIAKGGRLASRDGVGIDLSGAVVWRPPPPLAATQVSPAVADGLKALIAARAPKDGLLRLALDPTTLPLDATERAAAAPLRTARRLVGVWLDHDDPRVADALADLLGLGPGLTPAGDDLIAGLLIAAHRLGKGEEARGLWRRLKPLADQRTTPLSLAHLAAAGDGMGAAPLHDLLDALFDKKDDRLASALDSVARIGHSSGWDAVAGILVLLDTWIDTRTDRPAAA